MLPLLHFFLSPRSNMQDRPSALEEFCAFYGKYVESTNTKVNQMVLECHL
jgi:hypothetical protein